MKIYRLLQLSLIIGCLGAFSAVNAQDNSDKNKQIKVLPKTVELIAVSKTADKCPQQKGTTIRLRVISNSPVDIRRYANLGKVWAPVDFLNQKKGDEISTFMCSAVATFKFHSRVAGSSEEFPKF